MSMAELPPASNSCEFFPRRRKRAPIGLVEIHLIALEVDAPWTRQFSEARLSVSKKYLRKFESVAIGD
jgi:hypothetical protein